MIYRVVEKDGVKTIDVIAGTSNSGVPLGTWASFENDVAPNDEWIKEGETFDANTYPALAMMLGGNTVPERYDHSRLGAVETITLSTNSSSPTVMEYDGFIGIQTFFGGADNNVSIYINGQPTIRTGGSVNIHDVWFPVKAGDEVYYTYYNYNIDNIKARFYKHPLFIKATPTSSDSDYEGTLNAIRTYVENSNSYSTEETPTGGKWIDGKPIYRKVIQLNGISYFGWTTVYTDDSIGLIDSLIKVMDVDSRSTLKATNTPAGRLSGTSLQLYFPNGWTAYNVVIEYTKTTDN